MGPFFSAPGSGSPSPVEVAPAGLCRVVASILLGPRQWLPVPCGGCPLWPLSRCRLHSSRPQAVAPRPLWRLPTPASVASSPPFFTAPGSGSPSPVEVAHAGLCRVVASILHSPRQWLPDPCGGCPRRPLLRRRLHLLGPRQWLPVPCGGCPRRPLSRRRLHSSRPQAVAPRPLWRLPPPASVASLPPFFTAPGSGSPSPVEVAPAGLCRVVASILHGPRQWLPVPCGG